MSSPVGQFVLGFAIAFAPAPVVGFAAWSMVNSDAPAPAVQVQASPDYGSPLDREWSDTPGMNYDGEYVEVPEQPPMREAQQHEMEIETNCAKRKKRKQIEKRPKPEREIPDF